MLINVLQFLGLQMLIMLVGFITEVGKYAFASIQAAPSFSSSFPHIFKSGCVPCLIPCAVDQDPYFRLTRDIAPRLHYPKPALIHSKFIPALQGAKTKMSSSDELSSIYLSDSANSIAKKIRKYAFSGGKDTVEEQRKHGADLDVDVSIAYLNYFMEDEQRLEKIKNDYKAGQLLTGEVKNILIECIQKIVDNHQRAKNNISSDDILKFTSFK
ncbi:Tryptophan--tRNA ligase, cytoplasmic [Thelohanellus kitauei]|uniref:tryptophan--tRNA ligase n=1 Tax=Thelohanellus kitauei TaxID=669202 RepID=A0A0C2J9G5_THEKT|nr:Tryptophan--tRNA ligase, cytoplasmic [Thelohanellus kitauei]